MSRRARLLLAVVGMTLAIPRPAPVAAQTQSQAVSIGSARYDFADPALQPKSPAEKALVAAFVRAINDRDPSALTALSHPASRACNDTEAGRLFTSERHKRELAEPIPDNAKVIFTPFKDIAREMSGLTALGRLAVPPTAMLAIDYQNNVFDAQGVLLRHRGRTILRPVIEENGRMHVVDYCLTEEGERVFLAKRAKPPEPAAPR